MVFNDPTEITATAARFRQLAAELRAHADTSEEALISKTNDGHLRGKVAIVTGGGRGPGRATALALAAAGAKVVITAAREIAEIERVEAAAPGGQILALLGHVSKPEDCDRVVQAAVDTFGSLDILVANAGRGMKYVSENFLTEPTRLWETDPEIWRKVIDTNVNGRFFTARAAVPFMRKGGWGRIINVSMNRETMRRAGFSPYGPSKAALESETVIWSQDLKGSGVTVNAILPGGATLTGMIPDNVSDDVRAKLMAPRSSCHLCCGWHQKRPTRSRACASMPLAGAPGWTATMLRPNAERTCDAGSDSIVCKLGFCRYSMCFGVPGTLDGRFNWLVWRVTAAEPCTRISSDPKQCSAVLSETGYG